MQVFSLQSIFSHGPHHRPLKSEQIHRPPKGEPFHFGKKVKWCHHQPRKWGSSLGSLNLRGAWQPELIKFGIDNHGDTVFICLFGLVWVFVISVCFFLETQLTALVNCYKLPLHLVQVSFRNHSPSAKSSSPEWLQDQAAQRAEVQAKSLLPSVGDAHGMEGPRQAALSVGTPTELCFSSLKYCPLFISFFSAQ